MSFEKSINKLDESLSMLDTEKRLEELNSLAAVVDKQFVELFDAINKEPSKSEESKEKSEKSIIAAPEEQTLPVSLNEATLTEKISNLSLTVSDRERELDQ